MSAYVTAPQSTAQILPDEEEDVLNEDFKLESESSTPVADDIPPPETVSVDDASAEDEIPAQLRGKTAAQLAKMYTEAQQVIGRQGQEVGEVRRLADGLIKKQLAESHRAAAAAPLAPVEPVKDGIDADAEFFAKPRDAVSRAISEHPELKALRAQATAVAQRELANNVKAATAEFQTAYPDAQETLGDPAFREWIGSSKVRQGLLRHANDKYNLDAAHEIFGTWKALKEARAGAKAVGPTAKVRAAVTKKDVSAATVPSGNAGASADGGDKKIYRRVDLMNLMQNDPDRYEQLADEIQRAYAERRVR